MKIHGKRKAEMYRLIEKWRTGNKSQRIFCKEAGCSIHTFKYWRQKQIREQTLSDQNKATQASSDIKNRFVPLSVDPTAELSGFRIIFPNGVHLNCPGTTSVMELKELVTLF